MSADDPLDALTGSISDGQPVDWDRTDAATEGEEHPLVHALRDIERVAAGHRAMNRSLAQGATPGAMGSSEGASLQWGDLQLLELARTGASGEVWRAWDPWLQRDVALKFLQMADGAEVSDSALLREARALARVRHPGVVVVHGIARHDGRVGMTMEFLEGTTLAAEIERRGALAARAVARIGLELCRALETVEAAGVVHRDIKPANIVLEASGRAVLTDFGLGLRWELGAPAWHSSGTPIFMSPGILSGQPATPRSDLYALGVTLRWALTGRSPFRAQTLQELKDEAQVGPSTPLATERPDAPPALVAAIEKAMAPDPEARYAGAAQMASALEKVLEDMQPRVSRPSSRHWVVLVAALAVALGGAAMLLVQLRQARALAPVTSFSLGAPPHTTLEPEPAASAVSPDGRLLAFVAVDSNRVRRLWLRPLQSLSAVPLEGTEGADGPFWAPDGRHLGFFAEGKLKRTSVAGGPPEILCAAPDGRGASWGKSGVIVFAPVPAGSLCRISAEGGPVTEIQRPDSSRGETGLRWPEFLPDGRHFLFVTLPAREGSFDIFAASIDSKDRKLALRSEAAPVCSRGDELLLVRGGRLMTQRFDFATWKPLGEPVSLGPATTSDVSVGERLASVSRNGVLVQPYTPLANTKLVWLDRGGHPHGTLPIPEGRYEKMSLSPAGDRLVVVRRGSPTTVDLWMVDVSSGMATRLTSKSQTRIGGSPAWSPDGQRVAISSNREGPTNIFEKVVTQGGEERALYRSSAPFKEVDDWSPDGRHLLFEQTGPSGSWDLWILPVQGGKRPIPYLQSDFAELAGHISPDGRWAAYISNESGKQQVYVQSFPSPGDKFSISPEGGTAAWWSRDGAELAFPALDGTVWAVPVVTTPGFRAGTPKRLFKLSGDALWVVPTPDLQRFLVAVPAQDVPPPTLDVRVNWAAAAGK